MVAMGTVKGGSGVTPSMSAGYSGKPLAAKLGLREGDRALVVDAPPGYKRWLGAVADQVVWRKAARGELDFVHLFVDRRAALARRFAPAAKVVREGGMVWVSWPKKASGVPTDVTEDVVREVVLPTGWVDVKVAAVDETWSGLKFLRRRG